MRVRVWLKLRVFEVKMFLINFTGWEYFVQMCGAESVPAVRCVWIHSEPPSTETLITGDTGGN